jgi:tetratricopeptide (TPR) repeat protein
MNRTDLNSLLLGLLLPVTLAVSPCLRAQQETTDETDPAAALTREQGFMNAISGIESSEGAYAADLSEQMLSLGLSMQQQQRHSEAVAAFKRGVHLARINNGLYCAEQIPLLQGQINSHIAMGQYDDADERQHYLYRVQLRSQDGGADRASALLQQANWQFNAHQMRLGWQGPGRLMNMWNLYQNALNDILKAEGETSPNLLPPLYGMLRTQYLVSEFREASDQPGFNFGSTSASHDLTSFYTYRAESYDRGKTVILAIYDIQRANRGADSSEAIAARVMLGDWALWHEQRDDATELYQAAIRELEQLSDAQLLFDHFFAEPAMLPDIDGLRPLPPPVSAEQGNILVEFGVDSRGRVVDLERLDDNEDSDGLASRLIRNLRNTHFRPRFTADEPVGTDKLVRAYDIQ